MLFEIITRDPASGARRGRLHTSRGMIETPAFMPVGTQAAVKTMTPAELETAGAEIILGNAYHLCARPGLEVIRKCGGLHAFMGWPRPILTDSGGYQVFSLAAIRRIRADGVEFNSHYDGQRLFLGPVEVMEIQRTLGADIAMVFDECPPYPCDYESACQAVERTLTWAISCARQPRAEGQSVFGIVQGGVYWDLRRRCALELAGMNFDGYAVGGVSVGEPADLLLQSVARTVEHLPPEKPRYLMGVGWMRQIAAAAALGVDLFDCVIPTRLARHGTAFTRNGRYPLKAAAYREDPAPIESGCACYACRNFSRAYVRHLLDVGEILGVRLLTLHNVWRYLEFMRELRQALDSGRFAEFRNQLESQAAIENRGVNGALRVAPTTEEEQK